MDKNIKDIFDSLQENRIDYLNSISKLAKLKEYIGHAVLETSEFSIDEDTKSMYDILVSDIGYYHRAFYEAKEKLLSQVNGLTL